MNAFALDNSFTDAKTGDRCVLEMEEEAKSTPAQLAQQSLLRESQRELGALLKARHRLTLFEIPSFEADIKRLARPLSANALWPDHVLPMPEILLAKCLAYHVAGQKVKALRVLTRDAFSTIEPKHTRIDQAFVGAIQRLTLGFDDCMYDVTERTVMGGECRLEPLQYCNVYHGLLIILAHNAKLVYGGHAEYARLCQAKVEAWEKELELGKNYFNSRRAKVEFEVAQKKMLEWAGVSTDKIIKFA